MSIVDLIGFAISDEIFNFLNCPVVSMKINSGIPDQATEILGKRVRLGEISQLLDR